MKRIYKALTWFFRGIFPVGNEWERARKVWCTTDLVKIGYTGPHPKLSRCARELLNIVISPSAEEVLTIGLKDPDPRVVVYSLTGLEMLDSVALDSLNIELLERSEDIHLLAGSFLFDIKLNSFAEEVSKRRSQGRSLDSWLAYGRIISQETLQSHLSQLVSTKS